MVLQHEECEHLGILNELLLKHGLTLFTVRLYEGETVPDPSECSGVIILGGPMNVYDDKKYSFLKAEDNLLKNVLKNGIPTLGICLGAQLIAKAVNAKVYHGARKEIGWYPVSLTEEGLNSRMFKGFTREFEVFQLHGDTFNIPDSAVRLAWSEMYENQAFSIGDFCFAFQFHLEVTLQMIKDWIRRYSDELAPILSVTDQERLVELSRRKVGLLNSYASSLCRNFVNLL